MITTKQKRKLADRIWKCESIRNDPSSTKEEKARASDEIYQITRQIEALNDGVSILLEIDEIIMKKEK